MAKNALNELKFGPDMYFYGFYKILEDIWKIFKIGRFFAEKRPFSAFSALRNRTFFFDGKYIRAFKNAQNWLKISILTIYNIMPSTEVTKGILDILNFGHFIGTWRHQGGKC